MSSKGFKYRVSGLSIKETTPQPRLDSVKQKLRKAIVNEDQFELEDIFEEVNVQNLKHKLAENIEYTLKRDKIITDKESIVIPEGGYEFLAEEGSLATEGNFEIFRGPNEIIGYGAFAGSGTAYSDQEAELLSLSVNITSVPGFQKTQKPLRHF